jgi:hypothetical protein
VRCHGGCLCERCARLERLNDSGDVLGLLVHRGGLHADILTASTIRRGDRLTVGS